MRLGDRPEESVAVSVVVPARDAAPTLDRTLSALGSQVFEEEGFEVILVDDGSRDRTAEIASRYSFVRVVRNQHGQGPGSARNRGASIARAPVLAFTDADCFAARDWLARGLAAIRQADLVQGRVEPDPSVPRTPFDRSLSVDGDRGSYQTANLFVRRETFDAVGGFRDWVLELRPARSWSADRRRGRSTRTPIGEDTEFAWRARRLGASAVFAHDALVHHAVVPGTISDALADRWHWARDMAGLVKIVPELREAMFYRRVFFNHVSARFDLALAGLIAAAVRREMGWTLASLPYIQHLRGVSSQWGPQDALAYILGAPLVDALTLVGLITGSLTWRSLVL